MRSLCWKYSLRFRRGCCLESLHVTSTPNHRFIICAVLIIDSTGHHVDFVLGYGNIEDWLRLIYVFSFLCGCDIFHLCTYVGVHSGPNYKIRSRLCTHLHVCQFFLFCFFCNTLHILCCRDATKHQICICILPLLQRTVTWVITCLCLQLFSVH